MRIALVSDIHANLAAWNAVLADIAVRRVDRIACLGDIVGYGPEPADVLSSVYANVDHFVLGNHDAVAGGLMSSDGFNPIAQQLIHHTRRQLDDRAFRLFKTMPLCLKHATFRAAHGSVAAPGRFSYIMKKRDAVELWNGCTDRIVCTGHTHIPRLHVLDARGQYQRLQGSDRTVKLAPGNRYIINCGSVGLSRDGDFRACYAVLDTGARTVRWHRMAYDVQAFRSAVQRAYDDPELAGFLLQRIDQTIRRPVREQIDFTPGRVQVSGDVTEQREMARVRGQLRRWRTVAAATLVLFTILAAVAGARWRRIPRPVVVHGGETAPAVVRHRLDGWVLDYMAAGPPDGAALPDGWRAELADARSQTVQFDDGRMRIVSRTVRPLTVSLQPVALVDSGSIRWTIHAHAEESWDGEAPALVIDYTTGAGERHAGAERIVLRRDGRSFSRTHTIASVPRHAAVLSPRLSLHGSGAIVIETLRTRVMPDSGRRLLLEGRLDLNTAAADQLEDIPGIGSTLAGRIVARRTEIGGFEHVDQLQDIHGIGQVLLTEIRKYVRIGPAEE